jgi:hypothetical protein
VRTRRRKGRRRQQGRKNVMCKSARECYRKDEGEGEAPGCRGRGADMEIALEGDPRERWCTVHSVSTGSFRIRLI